MPEKRKFSSERIVYLGIIIFVVATALLTVRHFAGDNGQGQLAVPSAEIKKESMAVVRSAEGNAIVIVPFATKSSSDKIYVRQAENPSIDSDSRISSIYEFGPEGTSFGMPVEVRIRYYDELKSCPSSLFFRHFDKSGALKEVVPHKSIYCGVNFASFEISSFSQGYVTEDDGRSPTGRGNCEDWDRGEDGACEGAPHIDSINPITVSGGQSFTIKGEHLTRTVQFIDSNNNRHSINWANGITMNNARTEVIVPVPNELSAGKYKVRTWTSPTLVSNEVEITIEGSPTGGPGSGGTGSGSGIGQGIAPTSIWSPKQTNNGWFPQLSPDGRYVAYGFGESWVTDLQTGEERSFTIARGQSFYGSWISPGTYTFLNIYSDSEADRYEVKAGEWTAKKTNDNPSLAAGNTFVAADGHWASWIAGQNRIAYDNSVLATGHGVAIGEGGWLLHSDPEHTAMYVWHDKQKAATYAPQVPLHGWAISRGHIIYGGYGPVHGINPQGQDIDLTVAPWRWEGIGGVVFVNNQPWVYTLSWNDAQNKGYIFIRPWGEKNSIVIEAAAVSVHVVYANNEFVVAFNDDRGQLKVVKVPANAQRVDLSNPNSYNTGGNNVCNPTTPETPLTYPSCVEEIDVYAKCAREKDDVCIFAECRDVLWMTRNTNAALGCSQDFTYHGIPAATWRGWVENEAKAVLEACKDVCHPELECVDGKQPDSVDKDKLLQALENYWKNCINRKGISCVCSPNDGVCKQFTQFIGGGQCYTPPTSCQDACTPGEKRCESDNSGYEECGDSDNNGCFSWESRPCQNGCTNGNCNSQNNARNSKFGILYSTAHCPARNPPIDISEILAGRQQWGPVPAYHWWDEPQDGYYCLSTDENVLRGHAAKFKDAGIDFIVFSASEHPYSDSRSDRPQELLLQPLEKILQVWSTTPNAPKVAPWFPLAGDSNIDSAILPILEKYPNMRFIYQGKPLILTNAVDESRASTLAPRYTIRRMWGLEETGNSWSFLSKCSPGFKQSQGNQPCNQRVATLNGQPEQISVTAAYQETGMSDKRTAVPKFNGKTFVKQFQTVFDKPDAPIVIITGWNEWVVQRGCFGANGNPVGRQEECAVEELPDGSKIFTDEYDIEYSKDMEPAKNEKGDFYYQLMKSCIQKFRNGESSCDTNVQFTPYKTEPCANDANCAANNGKCENSNCVCRNNDNSCGSYPNCANCASQGKICGNGVCVVRQCTNTDGRKYNPGDIVLCGNCGTKTCQSDGTFGPCNEGAC